VRRRITRRRHPLPYDPMWRPKPPRPVGKVSRVFSTLLRFCTLGLVGRRRKEKEAPLES
jgi:hypothetical protein